MNESVSHVTSRRPAPRLETLRARIDDIDDEIFRQLEARASLMKEIAAAKRSASIELFPRRAMAAIFREAVSASSSQRVPE